MVRRRFGNSTCSKLAGGLLATFFVASCAQTQFRDVAPEKFVSEYDAVRTNLHYTEYRGARNGYHLMDVYGLSSGSWAEYQQTLRVPTNSLPSTFPDHPQQPIVPAYKVQSQQNVVDDSN